VRVVKSTLYRTGGPESGIIRALERAAAAGKQVVVLVELKALFDESANLERARDLERSGANVVYGVMGLKTHAKIAMVVRQEAEGLRAYCHIGTGNYNPVTARQYEDLGLLTASPEISRDVAELFNRLTSGSGARHYERLLVAPETLRSRLLALIRREAEAPDGRIVMKVNNLSDPETIDALYAASQAGAEIDLVVRAICCLRPGVAGLSEHIRVRSVLGRFLEHSRIFRFGSAARGHDYWIGSADLMQRNLDGRVEALVPIDDPRLQERLDQLLALYLRPDIAVWELGPDGAWKQSGGQVDLQAHLLQAR
jgi:polyphosphate kinase